MNFNAVRAIFDKEVMDFTRDRRTLISLVLFPVVVMPIFMFGMGHFISRFQRQTREKQLTVRLEERQPLPGLKEALGSAGIKVADSATADAAIRVNPGPVIEIATDNSKPEGNIVAGRVRQVAETLRQNQINDALRQRGVPESVLHPFKIQTVNTAPARKMSGTFIGVMLGFVLVIFTLSAAMYPAMDMTAGEKERRTLEILLSSPATRVEIVAGKVLATFLATVATTVLSVTSFGVTFFILRKQGGVFSNMGDMPIDLQSLSLLALAALPAGLFSAALTLAIAALARTTREATSYLTPLIFVAMFAGYSTMTPGIDLKSSVWLIPFANFCKLCKDLLAGEWTWAAFAITFAANAFYAAIACYVAVRCFRDEKILFRT